jgi:hypothetical protein
MAVRGEPITVTYTAWDTSNNVGKTGDAGNHTIKSVADDGTATAIADSPAELENGEYKITLTGAENLGEAMTIEGSSGANIEIIPTRWINKAPVANDASYMDSTVRLDMPLREVPDGQTGRFRDQSVYGHHGTLVGAATADRGRVDFNGSTGYVSIGHSDNLEFSCTATKGTEVSSNAGIYESSGTIVQSEDTPTTYWVAYRKNTNDSHDFDVDSTIVVRKSTDSGSTWAAEVEIADQGGVTYDMRAPQLCLFDNAGTETLVCFWTRTDVSTNHRVFLCVSTDAGASWTLSPVLLADVHLATKGRGRLMTDGNFAIALYSEATQGLDKAYFYVADSLNLASASWTGYTINDDQGDETSFIEVKTGGAFTGRLMAIVRDNANNGQYWKVYSNDYGLTWGTPVLEAGLEMDDNVAQGTPCELVRTVLPDDGTILAFHTRARQTGLTGTHTLVARRSFDEGVTWHLLNDIHYDLSISAYPSVVALSDGTYALTWCENGGTSGQYFDVLNANCKIAAETAVCTIAATVKRDTTNTFDCVLDLEGATQYRVRFEDDGEIKVEWGGNTTWNTDVFANDTLAHDLGISVTNYHMIMYKDGEFFEGNSTPGDLSGSTNGLFIGAQHASPASNFFDGVIANVILQATAWTAEQFRERYERFFQANRWEDQLNRMGSFTQADSLLSKAAMNRISVDDVYYADVVLQIDGANTQDEYTVQWYKNGAPVIHGITTPTIQVVKRADGTDLIASTALTQVGTTAAYRYDEGTNRVTTGESAIALVAAVIDGVTRRWRMVVGRDVL